jgi:hypothetical protein
LDVQGNSGIDYAKKDQEMKKHQAVQSFNYFLIGGVEVASG